MTIYEELLESKRGWALEEASMHFEEKSRVHAALSSIAKRRDALDVGYAIVGGMALFHHGYRRFTEDVDVLVSKQGLETLHQELEGKGYLTVVGGGRNLRDVGNGVRIEFLVAGDYPGDGKAKPVSFPDPGEVTTKYKGFESLICLG